MSGPIHVPAGSGTRLPGPAPVFLIARSEWTDGRVCVIDQVMPPKSITPAHRHTVEAQGAYVLSGTLGFWVDGVEETVSAGGYLLRPAGSVHTQWNSSDEPAHLVEITSPAAGFQEFVLAIAAHVASGGGGEGIRAIADAHGTTFFEDVTAELCRRYGVSTAGSGYAE
jgi:mannose-6-phosphate isomerase-like protein (cupin superfamily)